MCGDHIIGPHHFIVLVLEDMTMPDVTSHKTFETDNDPRHHSRVGSHRIFPASFVRIGRHRRTRVLQYALGFAGEEFDGASIEYLESNQMKMDGVRVIRQVNQVPDFDRVQDCRSRDRPPCPSMSYCANLFLEPSLRSSSTFPVTSRLGPRKS
jgi:hypothetical protein